MYLNQSKKIKDTSDMISKLRFNKQLFEKLEVAV